MEEANQLAAAAIENNVSRIRSQREKTTDEKLECDKYATKEEVAEVVMRGMNHLIKIISSSVFGQQIGTAANGRQKDFDNMSSKSALHRSGLMVSADMFLGCAPKDTNEAASSGLTEAKLANHNDGVDADSGDEAPTAAYQSRRGKSVLSNALVMQQEALSVAPSKAKKGAQVTKQKPTTKKGDEKTQLVIDNKNVDKDPFECTLATYGLNKQQHQYQHRQEPQKPQ